MEMVATPLASYMILHQAPGATSSMAQLVPFHWQNRTVPAPWWTIVGLPLGS